MLATPKNLATAKTTLKKMNAEIDLDCFQYRDYFPKSKKIAQFELLQREKHPDREYPFFNDFAYQWFERKKATWKNSYRNTIQNVLDKYLIPQFGNTLINEIILSQVDFYRQQLMQMVRADNTRQLSNRRINNLLWLIVSMVSLAAEEYKFEYPLRRYRSLKEEKAESHPMTIKEVEDVKLALGTFYPIAPSAPSKSNEPKRVNLGGGERRYWVDFLDMVQSPVCLARFAFRLSDFSLCELTTSMGPAAHEFGIGFSITGVTIDLQVTTKSVVYLNLMDE